MYNKFIILISVLMLMAACGRSGNLDPVDYVDPYIGNISHLLVPTYPTVHLPNAMMRVYPERTDFTSDRIKGLPLIVTSHRGKSAFNLSFFQGDKDNIEPYYMYHYDNEVVKPYYYKVYCEEEEVQAEFAPSWRSGVYDITFEKGGDIYIIVNANKGCVDWNGSVLTGEQDIDGNTSVYIAGIFSVQPENIVRKSKGEDSYLVLKFSGGKEKVTFHYGVSFIDEIQAKENMDKEIAGKTLDEVAADGRRIWNETLSKVKVEGDDEDAKTVFYTSLYRTYERMICLDEYGRYYSAFDGNVHEDEHPFYTDDWVWDTYRAVHPLRVLIEPDKESDMIRSYATMSSQMKDKWMPTFPEVTGDSRRMNSNHGVAFVADAWAKGLRDFDLNEIYGYCKAGITEKTLAPWSGVKKGCLTDFYWQNGYIPALKPGEKERFAEVHPFEKRQPVAVTLGTAYDEWCLARIADYIGMEKDYEKFIKGSYNYRNLFNDETLFFHPKGEDGKFITPFDYERSGGLGARDTYDENNAWVYRWDVQHNVADLVRLMGGPDNFIHELDRTFETPVKGSKYAFYAQMPDHTGNVGQFSMANEPSMHIPYLYSYAGKPWKTQKRVRTLLEQWFRNDVMGVPGDEDGGGLSSFVVFSMLGFYPVTPGLPMYVIGSPVFENAAISLADGKIFEVKAFGYSPDNKYIQSAKLNGKPFERSYLTHDEIIAGGILEVEMGARPNKKWAAESVPPSFEIEDESEFLLLGDMHYDRIENHDLDWLATTNDDLRQVTKEYTVFTEKFWEPFTGRLAAKANCGMDAVLQMGDLSEGLAGTPELAEQMAQSCFDAIDGIGFEIPFIMTKGNHDITGPGAVEAFDKIYLPNMARLSGHKALKTANYATKVDDCLFVCYDPWDKDNNGLDALESNLASSDALHKFVLVHEPVIPVNERCWHLLRRDNGKRERLLNIIAKEKAIVLCAHMHLYSVVRRDTDYGPIVQILVNSVIRDRNMLEPRTVITEYGPSLALNRPDWEPETMDQRLGWLDAEAEHVKYFKQMDLPGYGILSVGRTDGRIRLEYYAGFADTPYDVVDISAILSM